MMSKSKNKIIATLLLAFMLMVPTIASADSTVTVKETTGSQVSPSIINLSLENGEITESSFVYRNSTSKEKIIRIDIRPFRPSDGETGSPVFIDNKGKNITSPLAKWIRLEQSEYVVPAGQSQIINFSIKTPQITLSGPNKKLYTAIVASEQGLLDKDNSILRLELGTLIVANVTHGIIIQILKSPMLYLLLFMTIIALAAVSAHKRKIREKHLRIDQIKWPS